MFDAVTLKKRAESARLIEVVLDEIDKSHDAFKVTGMLALRTIARLDRDMIEERIEECSLNLRVGRIYSEYDSDGKKYIYEFFKGKHGDTAHSSDIHPAGDRDPDLQRDKQEVGGYEMAKKGGKKGKGGKCKEKGK